MAGIGAAAGVAGPSRPKPSSISSGASGASPSAPCTPAEKLAITTHCGGDSQLFTTYRAACLKQFAADVRAGDAAAQAQDWPALRRLAHSLATVLLTLGRPEDSLTARALEDAAAANAAPACLAGWGQLRTGATRGLPIVGFAAIQFKNVDGGINYDLTVPHRYTP